MSFEGSVFIGEARRISLIEYDAYTFKDVFSPLTIVSMKTDIGRTIYTCYLIAGRKIGE